MAMDPMDPNFPNQAYPPRKQGGSKLLMGLGIGCGLVLLLCCGGGVAIYWFARGAVSEDPARIAEVAREIAEVQLPPDLQPLRSVSMKAMNRGLSMAIYQSEDGTGTAILMEIAGGEALDPSDMREQAELQGQQQGIEQGDLVDVESREMEIQVRGEPAKFLIEMGKESQSNVEYIRGSGVFRTKDGVGMLMVQGPADRYTEEQIEETIRSVK